MILIGGITISRMNKRHGCVQYVFVNISGLKIKKIIRLEFMVISSAKTVNYGYRKIYENGTEWK